MMMLVIKMIIYMMIILVMTMMMFTVETVGGRERSRGFCGSLSFLHQLGELWGKMIIMMTLIMRMVMIMRARMMKDGNEDGLCCFWVGIWFQRGQKEQSCSEVSDYIDFANACAHRWRVITNIGSMILKNVNSADYYIAALYFSVVWIHTEIQIWIREAVKNYLADFFR